MKHSQSKDKSIIAYNHLIRLLCENSDKEHLESLLNALLTSKEQHELANRIQIFAMLQEGKPQREISETLGVGIATVSRGAKAYRQLNVNQLLPTLADDLINP